MCLLRCIVWSVWLVCVILLSVCMFFALLWLRMLFMRALGWCVVCSWVRAVVLYECMLLCICSVLRCGLYVIVICLSLCA